MARSADDSSGPHGAADFPDWLPGDRFRIRERLRPGGFGEVYLADDTVLHRKVALKRVRPDLEHDRDRLRGFVSEARHAGRLSDPHLATLYDVLVPDEEHLILVMEYVPGITLRERMRDPIDLPEFWDYALQIVEAVSIIHRNGFIHRDLKPENIMLMPSGQVKVVDLGLSVHYGAPEALESETLTMTTPPVAGTPPYMAPEAYRGEVSDPRSDLFSLGVVLYEMLAGRRPFRGDTRPELEEKIRTAAPDPPGRYRQEVPPALDHLILGTLEKEPARRPASAAVLLEDLVAARHGEYVIQTVPLPNGGDVGHRRRGRWWYVPAGLLAAAIVVLAFSPDLRLRGGRWVGWPPLPEIRRVAILPATTEGNDEHLAAFGIGLTDLVAERLDQPDLDRRLRVIPADQVQVREVTEPRQARTETGANLALQSGLTLRGTSLAVDLTLWDARRERRIDRRRVRGNRTEPGYLAAEVIRTAAEMLGSDGGDVRWALGQVPSSPFWFTLEGNGYLRSASDSSAYALAREHFYRATRADSRYAPAWIGLSRALIRLGEAGQDSFRLHQALAAADKALELVPEDPEALFVRGRSSAALNDFEDAIGYYSRALNRDPHSDEVVSDLAKVYANLDDQAAVERTWRQSVVLSPDRYARWWHLAYVHLGKDRIQEAIDAYHGMITAAPDFYAGYQGLGAVYLREANYRDAAAAMSTSLELKPEKNSFSNLATLYFGLRQFDEAIRTYQKAIALGAEEAEIWFNIADAYYFSGTKDRAEAAYRSAIGSGVADLREHPGNAWICARIADAYARIEMPDSARVWIARALPLAGEDGQVFEWLGLALWQLGRRDEAISALDRAVKLGVPRAWINDSAMFDPWREDPRFRKLVSEDAAVNDAAASGGQAGGT